MRWSQRRRDGTGSDCLYCLPAIRIRALPRLFGNEGGIPAEAPRIGSRHEKAKGVNAQVDVWQMDCFFLFGKGYERQALLWSASFSVDASSENLSNFDSC